MLILLWLGLATTRTKFHIIEKNSTPNKPKPCDTSAVKIGHEMKDCIGLPKEHANQDVIAFGSEVEFIFVRLNVLREYLAKELEMPNLPFEYNFERAIDDWVFMCFFVGNDFLPHLPSLEIREGAINRLVELYKKTVYKTGGFLTDSGNVNLDRVQLIMQDLGGVEDEIFKKRQQSELAFRAREKAKKRRTRMFQNWKPQWTPVGQFAPQAVGSGPVAPIQNARQEAFQMRMQGMHTRSGFGSAETQEDGGRGVKRKSDQMDQNGNQSDDEDNGPPDEVRLWEDGFKDRYYESKFDVDAKNMEFRLKVAHEYVRGLCWVLQYYYQGCASWKWYFPYHYAPFASDFINIGTLSTEFEKGTKPFRPLEQLMGVFPAASSSHVPPSWAPLMSDPESPIIDFYPEDFKIDLNGKKFAWQGVALLPFVDEKRLFKALEPYYSQLTDAEVRRNVRGDDRLYMAPKNTGYKFVSGLYENRVDGEVDISVDGIFGQVLLAKDCVSMGGNLNSPVRGLLGVMDNSVVTISFRDPKYPDSYVFPAKRLPGAKEPPKVLKPGDLNAQESRNWRPQLGMAPATQRASLGDAGHRMLGHQGVGRGNAGAGIYSAVPPMMSC
ncbi:5'-3' exoribonuclease, partial [Gryllus bimaculatus]